MHIKVSLETETSKAAVYEEISFEIADDRDPNGAVLSAISKLLNMQRPVPENWGGKTTIRVSRCE
jgi:hypothetical protein